MSEPAEELLDLLDRNPAVESDLEALLQFDRQHDTWTFDEIPLDSGIFGELVSRDIVVKTDDGEYYLTDPDLVEQVLAGEYEPAESPDTETPVDDTEPIDESDKPSITQRLHPRLANRNWFLGLALATSLVYVALFRLLGYQTVFREDHVTLPENDPYHFLHWTEHFLATSSSPWELWILVDPPGRTITNLFTYVTGWFATALVGGESAAPTVVAWLPVFAAIATGLFIYLLAVVVTDDRRIGVVAVLMFAVVPAHGFYSGVGFFDHHAFDYPLLALTAACLAWFARDSTRPIEEARNRLPTTAAVERHLYRRRTWAVAGGLGIVIWLQMLYWGSAPILLGAFGLYVFLKAIDDIRAGRRPLFANAPIVVALAIASTLGVISHLTLGWLDVFLVVAPALVFLGSVFVFAVGELVDNQSLTPAHLAGSTLAFGAISIGALWLVLPAFVDRLIGRFEALFFRERAAETRSLFAEDRVFSTDILGPIFGPMSELGLVFYIGLPVLIYACYRVYTRSDPPTLLLASYGLYFLAITSIQVRFAAEFSPFISVLAAIGIIHLLDYNEFIRSSPFFGGERLTPPVRFPSLEAVIYGGLIILIVGGVGFYFMGSMVDSVGVDDERYDAMVAIENHAETHDGPDEVMSQWSWHRYYNYFVTGDGDSYSNTYSEDVYPDFLGSINTDHYFNILRPDDGHYKHVSPGDSGATRNGGPIGYVVLEPVATADGIPERVTYRALFERLGSAGEHANAVEHFQTIHVTPGGTYVIMAVVPGATVEGTAEPNETVTAAADVHIPAGFFPFEAETTADADGEFAITLPNPGEYTIANETVEITEAQVRAGATIELDE